LSINNQKQNNKMVNNAVAIPFIGRLYHTSWAKNRGFVWKLISFNVDKNEAVLMTPKTKRVLTTKLDSLRDINKYLIN